MTTVVRHLSHQVPSVLVVDVSGAEPRFRFLEECAEHLPSRRAKVPQRPGAGKALGYHLLNPSTGATLLMNNPELMRQLQARMQKMQDDLATQTVEGSAGGGAVSVTISEIGMGPAQLKITGVSISAEAVDPEDVETLEDLVTAALNEALGKAQQLAAKQMAALTGGMKIPGLS